MDHVRIENGTFSSDGIDVEYLFQPARGDRQHLVVIFSGFRQLGAVDYYGEAQRSLRANILWIVDRFDDHFSYYLRAFGGRDITSSVAALIEDRRQALGLNRSQVTLAGFSKGGSAALYYGIVFEYPRVLAAAPRYRIGRYVKENWASELGAMTGHAEHALQTLDSTFDHLIAGDRSKNCRIVLVTSPADPQYLREVAPLTGRLRGYPNLHVISTRTPHVSQHIDVTRYNVPLINAFLTLATEGVAWPAAPSTATRNQDGDFNAEAGWEVPMTCNGMDALGSALSPAHVRREQLEQQILEAAATSVELTEKGVLFVEGYMFQRGVEIPRYGMFSPSLVLHDQATGAEHSLAVGALKNQALSANQFKDVWIDYSHAGFASMKNTGFDLTRLPPGRYRLDARWSKDGVRHTVRGIEAPKHESWRFVGDRWIGSVSAAGTWTLQCIDAKGRPPQGSFIELTSMAADASSVYPRGYFVPRGMDHPRWDSVRYALSTLPEDDSVPVRSFPLANDNRKDASQKTGEPWRDQSKAAFSTRRHGGLDVSSLAPGSYRLRVSARRQDDVQSFELPGSLTIEDGLPGRPIVGVIGSCVSRDNFSSRVRPGWRQDFELHGAFYQSSLISFMSPALEILDDKVNDLNAHDAAVTLADMRKGYRADIARDNPDFLIVDMFADVRMGVIGVEDTWITDNAWKIQKSAFYRSLNQNLRRSLTEDPERFVELFRQACERFAHFMATSAPRTRVVLNQARNVTRHRGFSRPGGMFDATHLGRMNQQWAHLDEIFLEVIDADVIDPMFEGAMGDSDHAWGSGPVHYENEVYERFRAQLRSIAGVDVAATWVPSAELDAGA